MRDKPKPQELYRHFKGNLYQIITIATDSETMKEMVVYQALYGDYKTYVRPLDMFMSEVDTAKYPDARQRMRFEKVTKEQKTEASPVTKASSNKTAAVSSAFEVVSPKVETPVRRKTVKESFLGYKRPEDKEPAMKSSFMDKTVDQEAEELNLNPLVIKFMDADLASEKNDLLSKLRPVITNDMIDIMALSLGVVINEGDVYDRFNDLRTCLNTMEKFESTRLRS